MTISPSLLGLQPADGEDLEPVVDAGPGVEAVHTGQGSVPGGPTEENPPGPTVEQRHGAHVTGLLVEVNITVCTEVAAGT